MPIFAARLARLLQVRLTGWRLPLAIAVVVFLSSWLLMALLDPALAAPRDYWWYFVITSATVGYGDLFPTTTGGRLVGAYVVVGGIVTLTLLFTRLAETISAGRSRRMRGEAAVDLADHLVLLGYAPGRTERIVQELTAEGRAVVLGAWPEQAEHPMAAAVPEVHFVRGDLTREDVLRRACVERARTVVVDGRDDNETLAIAVAVNHANPAVHLVAALRDLERREHLRYVNPDVQCVQWHMPYLLSEEATDPGITQVYNDLMSTGGHGNTYSLTVPAGFPHRTVGDAQTWLGRSHSATLLAVRTGGELAVSPPWDAPISQGATLYYVAAERIDARR